MHKTIIYSAEHGTPEHQEKLTKYDEHLQKVFTSVLADRMASRHPGLYVNNNKLVKTLW